MIIDFIPPIPDEILQAVIDDSLVIFLGAGISKQLGLPLWNELSTKLLDDLIKDKLLTRTERSMYGPDLLSDSKKIISIVYEKYKDKDMLNKYHSLLRSYLSAKSLKNSSILDFIRSVPSLYLTTNADNTLDNLFDSENRFYHCDFQWPTRGNSIVHIHGKLDEPSTLVFTSAQYISRYTNYKYIEYLERVFASGQTILFIGYSLTEFELLERIKRNLPQINIPRIYTLNPYYDYQLPLKLSMDAYFKSLSIEQLAYCISNIGYDQLEVVIRAWQEEIERNSLSVVKKKRIINHIQGKPDNFNLPQVQSIIKINELLAIFAIQQFSSSNYSLEWFEKFKNLQSTDISHIFKNHSQANSSIVFINSLIDLYIQTRCEGFEDIIKSKTLALLNRREISMLAKSPNSTVFVSISKIYFDFPEIYNRKESHVSLKRIFSSNPFLIVSFLYRLTSHLTYTKDNPTLTKTEMIIMRYLLETQNGNRSVSYIERLLPHILLRNLDKFDFEIAELCLEAIESQVLTNPYYYISVDSILGNITDSFSTSRLAILKILKYSICKLSSKNETRFIERLLSSKHSDNPIIKKVLLLIMNKSNSDYSEYLQSKFLFPFYDRNFFTDYYIYIKTNISSIPQSFIDFLNQNLNQLDIGVLNRNEATMILNVFDLLSGSKLPVYFNRYDELKIHRLPTSPLDQSKLVEFKVFNTETLMNDIKNSTKGTKNIIQICEHVEQLQQKSFISDYSQALKGHLNQLDNLEIVENDIYKVNPDFVIPIVSSVLSKSSDSIDKYVLVHNAINALIKYRKTDYLQGLFDEVLNENNNLIPSTLFTYELIQKLVLTLKKKTKLNSNESLLSNIDNQWIFRILKYLLDFSIDQFDEYFDTISTQLKLKKWTNELYGFVFYNIDNIYRNCPRLINVFFKNLINDIDDRSISNVFSFVFMNSFDSNLIDEVKKVLRSLDYFNSRDYTESYSEHLIQNELKWILENHNLNYESINIEPFISLISSPNLEILKNVLKILNNLLSSKHSLTIDEIHFFEEYLLQTTQIIESSTQANKIFSDLIELYSYNVLSKLSSSFFEHIVKLFNDQTDENYYTCLRKIANFDHDTVSLILHSNARSIPLYYLDQNEILKTIKYIQSKGYNVSNLINEFDEAGINVTSLI